MSESRRSRPKPAKAKARFISDRVVVVAMLACFIIGLLWICTYYIAGDRNIPVIADLDQWNLLVGIGFMALGFVFATQWGKPR